MFKVIYGFIDSVENKNYKAGDEFVVGEKTDAKRIASLMGYTNNISRPLIEEVKEVAVEEPQADPIEEPTEEEKPQEEPQPEESKPLDQHTIEELKEIATANGLEFKARATKSELIALIKGE